MLWGDFGKLAKVICWLCFLLVCFLFVPLFPASQYTHRCIRDILVFPRSICHTFMGVHGKGRTHSQNLNSWTGKLLQDRQENMREWNHKPLQGSGKGHIFSGTVAKWKPCPWCWDQALQCGFPAHTSEICRISGREGAHGLGSVGLEC